MFDADATLQYLVQCTSYSELGERPRKAAGWAAAPGVAFDNPEAVHVSK